jgi:hypothetical protein
MWIRSLMPSCTPLPVVRPCAVEPHSTFRPTRAIQSFSFQRGAPEPRGITVTGSDPASDGEPTLSPRRAHSGGLSLPPKRPSAEPVTRRRVQPRAPVPVALDLLAVEPSLPPCGETERSPDSSAPFTDEPRVDGLARDFRLEFRPTHQPSAYAILTTHGHTWRALRQPDCVTFRPRLLLP